MARAGEDDHELNYTAMIRTIPPPKAAGTVYFSLDVDELPAAMGSRPRPALCCVWSAGAASSAHRGADRRLFAGGGVPRCSCAADGERRGCRRPGPMPRGYLATSSSGSDSRASRWGPPESCPAEACTTAHWSGKSPMRAVRASAPHGALVGLSRDELRSLSWALRTCERATQ